MIAFVGCLGVVLIVLALLLGTAGLVSTCWRECNRVAALFVTLLVTGVWLVAAACALQSCVITRIVVIDGVPNQ
jgi:hypothetical protein